MLRIKTFNFIPRKKKTATINQSELELISAVYSINDAQVTLTFNRAIVTDLIDTHAFKVYDGIYANALLDGATFSPYGSDAVIIYFDQLEAYSSSSCTMNVSAASGIVDSLTGEPWGGVSGYELTTG